MKFCGLTRAEDARVAAGLGAGYLGVIFAGGPRVLTPGQAARVFDGVAGAFARVGVFGPLPAAEIAALALEVRLDVVQLHGDPEAADVDALRRRFAGQIWAVIRTVGAAMPPTAASLFRAADAVVLDARVAGALGGTGVALDWEAMIPAVARVREGCRLVLAGGLTAENVAGAATALSPDVVDVSSGVESATGVKDHASMARFAAAVP